MPKKEQVKQTKVSIIKLWVERVITIVIVATIALVGMSVLKVIDLPEVAVKAVGYGLIVASVVYLARKLK